MIQRHRHVLRLLLVGAFAVSISAPMGLAQATQPSAPQGRRAGAGRGRANVTRDERLAAENWAAENMPNLSKIMTQLQIFNPRRIRLGNFAVNRMRSMEDARRDPGLLERARQTARAEDEIFGYVSQLENSTPEEQQALRTKIREKMSGIIGDVFQERERRIQNLKARLAAEERKLAEDRANLDQIVSARLRSMTVDPQQSDSTPLSPPAQFNAMQNPKGK
jgi:hypothetical protein